MPKVLITVLVVGTLISGAAYAGYKAGINYEQASQLAIIQQYQDSLIDINNRLDTARQERRIVYRDKIKVVREAQSDCADTRIDPDILRVLSESGGGPGRSEPDRPD